MAQIPSITSGQLIDQRILNQLIESINLISNAQYSASSSIGNAGSTSPDTLQNGQWIVNTGYLTVSMATKARGITYSEEYTSSFPKAFAAIPIVTVTAYSSNTDQAIQTDLVYSVVVTSVTAQNFKFKIAGYSEAARTVTAFGIMYTAIGKSV
jgi:hypothetical protein